jgi:hypothetical protein
MARIKDTSKYGYDTLPSLDDYVIGTDAEDLGLRTKNYRIQDILSLATGGDGGDNLGNHIATQTLDMGGFGISDSLNLVIDNPTKKRWKLVANPTTAKLEFQLEDSVGAGTYTVQYSLNDFLSIPEAASVDLVTRSYSDSNYGKYPFGSTNTWASDNVFNALAEFGEAIILRGNGYSPGAGYIGLGKGADSQLDLRKTNSAIIASLDFGDITANRIYKMPDIGGPLSLGLSSGEGGNSTVSQNLTDEVMHSLVVPANTIESGTVLIVKARVNVVGTSNTFELNLDTTPIVNFTQNIADIIAVDMYAVYDGAVFRGNARITGTNVIASAEYTQVSFSLTDSISNTFNIAATTGAANTVQPNGLMIQLIKN